MQNNTLAFEGANASLYRSTLSLARNNWLTINGSSVSLDSSRLNFSDYFTWSVGGWAVGPTGC